MRQCFPYPDDLSARQRREDAVVAKLTRQTLLDNVGRPKVASLDRLALVQRDHSAQLFCAFPPSLERQGILIAYIRGH